QRVVLVYDTIEKWLAWPRDFDDTAVVAHDSLEYAQSLACRYHALGDHAADYRRVHSRLERRDMSHRACIFVAARHVPQQVASRDDAELAQRLRTRWPDTLEEIDRRIEPHSPGHRR